MSGCDLEKRSAPALLLSVCSALAVADSATTPLPSEVTAFIEQRDRCDHFRGEDPYDQERRRFLQANIAATCTGTDARLVELKREYRTMPSVISILERYEADIEPDR